MRLLLDTHIILWHLMGERRLSTEAQTAVESAEELSFSVISFAEIGIKVAVGKLSAPHDLHDRIVAMGVRILNLSPDHGLAVGELPMHHRDPFDRLLIAQAQANKLTIVTADRRMRNYEVDVVVA